MVEIEANEDVVRAAMNRLGEQVLEILNNSPEVTGDGELIILARLLAMRIVGGVKVKDRPLVVEQVSTALRIFVGEFTTRGSVQ